jgi:hypothetical protein
MKRKQEMALCGEIYLEEFMDLLLKTDYVMNEWIYDKKK